MQLIQIMTDKFSTPCENPGGLSSSCGNVAFAYFSCANVEINGENELKPFYKSLTGKRSEYMPGEANDNMWQV